MKMIKLSDVTMKQVADGFSLSFKEKIELAKLLDKLGVLSLGIVQGTAITLIADGSDEEAAIKALAELVENGLEK